MRGLLEHQGQNTILLKQLIYLLRIQGKHEDALKQLYVLLTIYPEATVHNDIGLLLYMSGKQDAARKRFDEGLKKYPRNELLRTNYQRLFGAR